MDRQTIEARTMDGLPSATTIAAPASRDAPPESYDEAPQRFLKRPPFVRPISLVLADQVSDLASVLDQIDVFEEQREGAVERGFPLTVGARLLDGNIKSLMLAAIEAALSESAHPERPSIDALRGLFDSSHDRVYASVEPAAGHTARWVATVCVLAIHGADCALAVFAYRDGEIRRELEMGTAAVTRMSDAVWALDSSISPPDKADGYFLVVAHSHPWVAGSWRTFEYVVLSPTDDPTKPAVLLRDEVWMVWIWHGLIPRASRTGFTLEYEEIARNDSANHQLTTLSWGRRGSRFVRRPSPLPVRL